LSIAFSRAREKAHLILSGKIESILLGLIREQDGGADEIRTHDLCSAIAALSHLSYSPGLAVFTSVSL
jgi:hypothetical protein